MTLTPRKTWRTRLAGVLGLLLLACGGGGGAPVSPPAETTALLSGRIIFSQSGPGDPILEAEPNDSADTAHYLGEICAGDVIVVHGHTTAIDDSDPFDGFQLTAPNRVQVTATLEFPDGGGNDFDMGVYDLVSMQFVENFLAVTAPEIGVFHAKGSFDLVVSAYVGEGDYVLTIAGTAPAAPIPEREPNGSGAQAQFLGEVLIGDAVSVHGTADDLFDVKDGVLVTCPVACRIQVSLAFPPGDDFDVRVYDATDGLAAPTLLAAFESPTNNPETGNVSVPGSTLLYVDVIPFDGSGSWTLTLSGLLPPTVFGKTGPSLRERLAPLAAEATRWKGFPGRGDYGRPRLDFVAGEALVAFDDERADVASIEIEKSGGHVRGPRSAAFARLDVDLPEALDELDRARFTLSRIAALRSSPGVRYAEPNYRCHAHAEPDDTYYNLQWHYPLIHLDDAWNVTTGTASVIVAVVDTGRRNHPDLAGRQVGGYDFVSDVFNARDGDGMDPDPTDPGDLSGADGTSSFHGTHVAGTIGAATNNDSGVAGVTWQTTIMHLRVLGRQGGTIADIADAIRYAARLPNGSGTLPPERAHIVNMSLGGAGYTQTLQDAIHAARAAGVVIFASAGNEATSAASYPAAHDGVVSISAVDLNGDLAPYSNYGSTIDLAAPGGDTSVDRNGDGYVDGVLSTLYDDGVSPPNPFYVFYQGTSMSCPHAAGVAALLLAVNPALTPDEVEAILANTAHDRGAPGRDDSYGHGLIDAHAAVLAAQGGGAGTPHLLLAPTALNFGGALSTLNSIVTNGGGGTLEVTTLTTTTQAGGPWLAATTTGAGDATRNVDGVRVTVDRTGLPDGSYSGRVTVASNGGTETLQVLMAVGAGVPSVPDVNVYVLAVDATTYEAVREVVVNPTGDLAFTFPSLPAGVYVIAAGTDLDDDGYICDEGEYCGMYPVVGEPIDIVLTPGASRTGVEFVVAPDQPIGTSTARATRCGLRRVGR